MVNGCYKFIVLVVLFGVKVVAIFVVTRVCIYGEQVAKRLVHTVKTKPE